NYNLEILDEGGTVSEGASSTPSQPSQPSNETNTTPTTPSNNTTQPSQPTQPTQTVVVKNFTGSVNYQDYVVDTVTVNSGATKIEGYLYGNSYDDLDLYLYDPNQNLVTSSTNYGSNEYVSYNNPQPGTWYFVVYAYDTYYWSANYFLQVKIYYG
ncbi:pre-peptidase C-terminal domain-containing protein, partial [Thermococcus sp.]